MPEIRKAAAIVDSTIKDLSHLHLSSTQEMNQVELIKARLAVALSALQDARRTVDQLEAELLECQGNVATLRGSRGRGGADA